MNKLNKYQNFYIDTTLEQLDTQYKKVNEELKEIYKKYSKNHDKLIQEISKVMMEYNIKAEFMELSKKEQIQINKKMQISIYDLIVEEESSDRESIKKILGDAVANTYKYQEYILGLGLDFKSLPLPEKVIAEIVNNKIAGEIWDKRLWTNKRELEKQLKKDIDDFVKGKLSVNKIGQNVRKNFETDRFKSQRLVRTEVARVQSEILNKFDKDHDVEWQLFTATLDSKTSKVCRDYDGIQYKITDKNKPTIPVHPNCRSCFIGLPTKDYKPTTRRDNETGEFIPYQKYEEWVNNK